MKTMSQPASQPQVKRPSKRFDAERFRKAVPGIAKMLRLQENRQRLKAVAS
jgi:hypothetical protein